MNLRQILLRVLAGIGALAILVSLLGSYAFYRWLNAPVTVPDAPANMVLELDFTKPVVEQTKGFSLALGSLLQAKEETPLMDIVRALDRGKDDPHVKGVVARMGSEVPSLVHVQEIRSAMERFRQSGKFSYIFAVSYGSFGQGNRAYYLASAFENIWLQPVGTVGLTGLGVETPFAKTALNNIGVTADFMRREEYKSVMENVTRDDFSPFVRDNMENLLKNLSEQLVAGIAESRKLAPAKVREWMMRGPFTASEALREGIVTNIGYANEMLEVAKVMGTAPAKNKPLVSPVRVDPSQYLAFAYKTPEPKAKVALINGTGLITDAPSGPSSFSEDQVIDTDKIVQAFSQAASDDDIDAILFRVNSPGGSPDASETIRHAIVKAKKANKPVFVSMGDVAASGGYWIVMNADHIVAQPGTITGSIGVVAGKFVIDGLSQKVGVKWDSLSTNANALMWSPLHPFTERERERMNALLDDTYTTFVKNVAEARKIPMKKMPDIAKGRVWTGHQAINVGLVDELGGMHTAIAAIKKRLKLEPTDLIQLKLFPPPETPATLLIKILRNLGVEAALLGKGLGILQQTREVLGPLWNSVESHGAVATRLPAHYMRVVK